MFEDLDLAVLRARRNEKWRGHPPDVLPAFIAEMDYDLAPPVTAALRAAVERGDCGYANPAGVGEAFAAFAAARHGWTVDPARVHLIPDVMGGVDAVVRLLTEPGAEVVINPPVYPPFFEHITVSGRIVKEVPLTRHEQGWDLDLDQLERAFAGGARCYLLCNPHNPVGRVFEIATLRAIAELAGRYGVTVICDEIHAPLTLTGATHTPFVTVSEEAAVQGVTLASASKAFNIPGLKAAVAVAGDDAMNRVLDQFPSGTRYGAGLLGILASEAAWLDGGEWLDALLVQLDGMRELFGKLVASRLPGAVYLPPQAGYLAWVDCTALGLGEDPAAAFLERGRVALGRGLDFGAEGAGFARVTLATSTAILTDIVDRMAVAL